MGDLFSLTGFSRLYYLNYNYKTTPKRYLLFEAFRYRETANGLLLSRYSAKYFIYQFINLKFFLSCN